MRWTITLLSGWLLLFGLAGVQRVMPPTFWFTPSDLRVDDSRDGVCPTMQFDREIRRPFRADWRVTVMRENVSGRFTTFRTYPRGVMGSNDYRPGNTLPDELDLCWWTWEEALNLPPGRYRVHTLWVINPDGGGGAKTIRRASNVFEVLGHDEAS